jgi:cytochrome c553
MRPPSRTMLILAIVLASVSAQAAADDGAMIYRAKCASCHGGSGEGSAKEYPHPLAGDRSVPQLAKLIAKTMPSDDPGSLSADDAQRVAAYISDAFYSPTAQGRIKPLRRDLSRLTVRQYRNAAADLIASFRSPPPPVGPERGLKAEYYKTRRFNQGDRVLERVDPSVAFDYADKSPIGDKIDPHEFSIRWEGSVLAPETGEYEFVVRTDHAMKLWVNNPNRPLIDALVKSGNDNEYRGTIFLLGGRSYGLKLDFIKANQGVDDSKKAKQRPPAKASIALLWKVPGAVVQTIPRENLVPVRSPESFALSTPFPPDDRSLGFERGSSISKAWDAATTDAAIEIVNEVTGHIKEFTGVRDNDPERGKKYRDLAKRVAEKAFRRPLTSELESVYVSHQFERVSDSDVALKRSLLLILKSPRFLYRELGTDKADPYDAASRLAFALWDAPPDGPLLEAAAQGKLATREGLHQQAERMANDPRAKAKLRGFLMGWLRVDPAPDMAKDPERFPEFTPEILADLRTSLELFLDDVVWGEKSDYRDLLSADFVYLNGRLAKIYGVSLPPDAPFTKVTPEPRDRAGVLTHPYLMTVFAYTGTTSPIHRGVFLSRSLLGRALRPPPEAVAPLAPDLHPSLTTRERTNIQTSPAACMTCHGMVNPLGFALEHFDAIGRYRTEERGRPIDSSGQYQTRSEGTATFAGARDLAMFLSSSEEAHDAFVKGLFHHMVKQPIGAFPAKTLPDLRASFTKNGYHIRKLMIEIAVNSSQI